ncbi:phosphatidylethanolamine-binding protein [Bombardia bombarda]|uniref:Phosphatidylethanolamine-binding protein n=1 Tax=Bombardia bombarda TaxID=252184 RepID=A0AA39XLV5_9PEZI|nr:phosphatidylethanolamine-binding protein [Bombardia bombarda]
MSFLRLFVTGLALSPVRGLKLPHTHSQQQVLDVDGAIADTAATNAGEKIQKLLKKAEIIPTVIDDFVPALTLAAKWPSDEHAKLGNTLKPNKLQDAPSISLHSPSDKSNNECSTIDSQSKASYVIALTDPDAPSRDDPKWSEMCHWIAVGRASASSNANTDDPDGNGCVLGFSDLDEVMPYKAPGPPEKTGKHRYVFFAFRAKNGTTDALSPSKPEDRQHWGYGPPEDGQKTHGVRDWAQDNGLVPVAANFIYSKNKKQ